MDNTAPKAPFRRPDWRFRRAAQLTAKNLHPSRRWDDYGTRQACCFLRRCVVSDTEERRRKLHSDMPLQVAAFRLYDGGARTRSVVEARVLARQSAETIASLHGVPIGVIQIYESWFFDVRSRLGHPDFILNSVIGLGQKDHGNRNDEVFLKLAAYLGGSEALNQLLFTGDLCETPSQDNLQQALVENSQFEMSAKIWRAAQLLNPADDAAMRQLLAKMLTAWERSATKPDPRAAQYDSFLENAEAFLSGIEPTMASDAKRDVPPEIRELEEAGVELRADDEMFLAAEGKLPDEILKHYQSTSARRSPQTDEPKEGAAP